MTLLQRNDTINPAKKDGAAYRIPWECSKVYIGETVRSMQERIKEHDRDTRLACNQASVVSKNIHKPGHHPIWNEAKFID